tara:strand:+ start:59 stop:1102 length:1044 start_codon:yes stop_codon:yes gene_type:complete
MSWHFSQAQGEESSVDICLDGEQCVQSKTNPTPSAFCSKDKMTRFSRLSQYGMTFAPLTEDRGEALLTWFLGGFHVPISQLPEKEQVSKEKKADSGQKWRGSLAKYDLSTHSLKTAQCSLLEDSTQSSVILPNWGLMQDGELLEQTMSGQIIKENASGLSQEMVHTPTATANQMAPSMRKSNYWPTPDANMGARGTQENWTKTRPSGQPAQYTLNQAVRDSVKMWPTPTAGDHGRNTIPPSIGKNRGFDLSMKVLQVEIAEKKTQTWPTPTATEARQGYQDRTRGKKGTQKSLTTEVIDKEGGREKTGGQLCPIFVEYLMGWPLDHTDLKPLETDKYQKWLELHGKY